MREPDVILVREEDDVLGAQGGGLLKIPGEAQILLIAVNMNREGGLAGKIMENVQGSVGGAVITNHQFIGQAGLPQEAVQLLLEEPLPVIRGHGYGDGERFSHIIKTLEFYRFCSLFNSPKKILASNLKTYKFHDLIFYEIAFSLFPFIQ